MRADVLTPALDVRPGQPIEVELEVLNTTDVIDRITCELPDHLGWQVEQHPSEITLFPGERAALSMVVHVPLTYDAGEHELLLRTHGAASGRSADRAVTLDVLPITRPRMRVNPARVTAGRTGRFDIEASNDGNTPITLVLHATDPESRLRLSIEPAELHLAPGEQASARLIAKHRRPLTGSIETRYIQIAAECLPEAIGEEVVFRQKPIFPPGFMTALTLAFIIAVWAVAIMFGVRAAFKADPPKKTVPVAFATGLDPNTLDPAVLGADVSGSITASTTGRPLARITVELFDSKGVRVAAGATKDDGTFALPAVLPGSYTMRYRAAGFTERWYPNVLTQAGATPVRVVAATPLKDLAASISGAAGTMEGVILAGDTAGVPVEITLTPVDLLPGVQAAPIAPQHITAGGTFRFKDLPTPATYRIRAIAPGFQPQEVQQVIPGGGGVVLNTIRLSAGSGSIAGTVTDPSGIALGEVKITTTVGGAAVATVTPTAGQIGQYILAGLASPSSYVVTFSRPGYGTEVVAVPVTPGEQKLGVNVIMAPLGASVTGVVKTADGTPLGDAEVAVVGGPAANIARTFTSGQIGGYRLSGLTVPGTYTLAVSKIGFRTETLRVVVTKETTSPVADVILTPSLGVIRGTIHDGNGSLLGGANIKLTDGATERTTTTASAPVGKIGTFELVDVPPGTYTLTASSTSCVCPSIVRLLVVSQGSLVTADATLGGV